MFEELGNHEVTFETMPKNLAIDYVPGVVKHSHPSTISPVIWFPEPLAPQTFPGRECSNCPTSLLRAGMRQNSSTEGQTEVCHFCPLFNGDQHIWIFNFFMNCAIRSVVRNTPCPSAPRAGGGNTQADWRPQALCDGVRVLGSPRWCRPPGRWASLKLVRSSRNRVFYPRLSILCI